MEHTIAEVRSSGRHYAVSNFASVIVSQVDVTPISAQNSLMVRTRPPPARGLSLETATLFMDELQRRP